MTRDEARRLLGSFRAKAETVIMPAAFLEAICTLLLDDDGTRAALASVFLTDDDPSEAAIPLDVQEAHHDLDSDPLERFDTDMAVHGAFVR
jgi:hypothetical protein